MQIHGFTKLTDAGFLIATDLRNHPADLTSQQVMASSLHGEKNRGYEWQLQIKLTINVQRVKYESNRINNEVKNTS